MEKRNFSINEYRETYGPSKSKIYELIAAGKLKTVKYGRRTFITVESAEALRASLLAEAED